MTKELGDLGDYKGYPITGTRIVVKSLGDGLSSPVAVEPVVIEPNERPHLGVRLEPSKHRYEFEKDDDGFVTGVILVQEFKAVGAAFADGKLIGAAIQKNVDAIKEMEALKKNQLTLAFDDNVTQLHKRPRAGKDAATGGD
jgi:hypothetical protein